MQTLIQKIPPLLTHAPYQDIGLLSGLSGEMLFLAESTAFAPENRQTVKNKLELLAQKLQEDKFAMTYQME
jgi:hypothetical protein